MTRAKFRASALMICAALAAWLGRSGTADDSPKTVQERYPSGRLKSEYAVDAEGRRHGPCTEYSESGKTRLTASYEHGAPAGKFEWYFESGKTELKKIYENGLATQVLRYDEGGTLVHHVSRTKSAVLYYPFNAKLGVNAHPRAVDAMKKRVQSIETADGKAPVIDMNKRYVTECNCSAPYKAGKLSDDYLKDALRHTQAYRYLCDVSSDMSIDRGYCDLAQHASVILAKIRALSHEPPKPDDMDDAFYKKAFEGAKSNIAYGSWHLRGAIDFWWDDSDDRNISRVAHRVWLLNPRLKKVGFGEADIFQAVWVQDESGSPKRADPICYPARGWFPAEYFTNHTAWSASFDPVTHQVAPSAPVQVKMWLLDDDYDLAESLTLNHNGVFPATWGVGLTLIFRPTFPKEMNLEGRRFRVDINGVCTVAVTVDKKTGVRTETLTPYPVSYLVEFFTLKH